MFRVERFVLPGAAAVVVWLVALAGAACAEDNLWQTNFAESQAKAKAENKLLLVDFTGSDWCGWCIKLKDEVFSKKEFQAEAPKKFVLVELDFPRQKKLPDELKTQNDQLAKQYKVRGFPSILLLDAAGQVIARTGYRPDGPEKYVAHLAEFVKIHDGILKMRTELATVQGLNRAKLLDQLVEAYGKLDNEIDEIDAWGKEIITLDADNKAGLKPKYEYRLLLAESAKLKEARKFDEAKLVIDKALALPGLTSEQKQDAYFTQGECCFYLQDYAGIVACLKKAHEAAPQSAKASSIQEMQQRFAPIAEAQETVARIKGELDKAQGLDRAKLLDQMIDARSKLGQFVRDANPAQDLEKWTQEIITLDADNKAGLKGKYQFRVLVAESGKLLREKKFDEAQAVLDKALAIPALTGEQVQEARFTQGTCYLNQEDYQKAADSFKKASEAAPDGPRNPAAQAMLRRAENELEKRKTKEQPKAEPKQEEKPKK
ncbi:MAG: thioredoxin fold domain-containing protein [Planctomycetota bacterium]|nr:thioredoxin fold domain-containing protein [Planctomycetota bacterium]